MIISVRDIQEKEFATQVKDGYDVEQVDDFLDEIVEKMSALLRENMELSQQVSALTAEAESARQALAAAEAKTPEYNEKDYFQNLQNAMRESLIGAQRIADETVDEANQKAQKAVADAQAQAERVTAEARDKAASIIGQAQAQADELAASTKGEVEALQSRLEALKASAKAYKADFSRLVEQQMAALRESNGLF